MKGDGSTQASRAARPGMSLRTLLAALAASLVARADGQVVVGGHDPSAEMARRQREALLRQSQSDRESAKKSSEEGSSGSVTARRQDSVVASSAAAAAFPHDEGGSSTPWPLLGHLASYLRAGVPVAEWTTPQVAQPFPDEAQTPSAAGARAAALAKEMKAVLRALRSGSSGSGEDDAAVPPAAGNEDADVEVEEEVIDDEKFTAPSAGGAGGSKGAALIGTTPTTPAATPKKASTGVEGMWPSGSGEPASSSSSFPPAAEAVADGYIRVRVAAPTHPLEAAVSGKPIDGDDRFSYYSIDEGLPRGVAYSVDDVLLPAVKGDAAAAAAAATIAQEVVTGVSIRAAMCGVAAPDTLRIAKEAAAAAPSPAAAAPPASGKGGADAAPADAKAGLSVGKVAGGGGGGRAAAPAAEEAAPADKGVAAKAPDAAAAVAARVAAAASALSSPAGASAPFLVHTKTPLLPPSLVMRGATELFELSLPAVADASGGVASTAPVLVLGAGAGSLVLHTAARLPNTTVIGVSWPIGKAPAEALPPSAVFSAVKRRLDLRNAWLTSLDPAVWATASDLVEGSKDRPGPSLLRHVATFLSARMHPSSAASSSAAALPAQPFALGLTVIPDLAPLYQAPWLPEGQAPDVLPHEFETFLGQLMRLSRYVALPAALPGGAGARFFAYWDSPAALAKAAASRVGLRASVRPALKADAKDPSSPLIVVALQREDEAAVEASIYTAAKEEKSTGSRGSSYASSYGSAGIKAAPTNPLAGSAYCIGMRTAAAGSEAAPVSDADAGVPLDVLLTLGLSTEERARLAARLVLSTGSASTASGIHPAAVHAVGQHLVVLSPAPGAGAGAELPSRTKAAAALLAGGSGPGSGAGGAAAAPPALGRTSRAISDETAGKRGGAAAAAAAVPAKEALKPAAGGNAAGSGLFNRKKAEPAEPAEPLPLVPADDDEPPVPPPARGGAPAEPEAPAAGKGTESKAGKGIEGKGGKAPPAPPVDAEEELVDDDAEEADADAVEDAAAAPAKQQDGSQDGDAAAPKRNGLRGGAGTGPRRHLLAAEDDSEAGGVTGGLFTRIKSKLVPGTKAGNAAAAVAAAGADDASAEGRDNSASDPSFIPWEQVRPVMDRSGAAAKVLGKKRAKAKSKAAAQRAGPSDWATAFGAVTGTMVGRERPALDAWWRVLTRSEALPASPATASATVLIAGGPKTALLSAKVGAALPGALVHASDSSWAGALTGGAAGGLAAGTPSGSVPHAAEVGPLYKLLGLTNVLRSRATLTKARLRALVSGLSDGDTSRPAPYDLALLGADELAVPLAKDAVEVIMSQLPEMLAKSKDGLSTDQVTSLAAAVRGAWEVRLALLLGLGDTLVAPLVHPLVLRTAIRVACRPPLVPPTTAPATWFAPAPAAAPAAAPQTPVRGGKAPPPPPPQAAPRDGRFTLDQDDDGEGTGAAAAAPVGGAAAAAGLPVLPVSALPVFARTQQWVTAVDAVLAAAFSPGEGALGSHYDTSELTAATSLTAPAAFTDLYSWMLEGIAANRLASVTFLVDDAAKGGPSGEPRVFIKVVLASSAAQKQVRAAALDADGSAALSLHTLLTLGAGHGLRATLFRLYLTLPMAHIVRVATQTQGWVSDQWTITPESIVVAGRAAADRGVAVNDPAADKTCGLRLGVRIAAASGTRDPITVWAQQCVSVGALASWAGGEGGAPLPLLRAADPDDVAVRETWTALASQLTPADTHTGREAGRFSFVEHGSGEGVVSLAVARAFPNATVLSLEGDADATNAHLAATLRGGINNNIIARASPDAAVMKRLSESPEFFRYQLLSRDLGGWLDGWGGTPEGAPPTAKAVTEAIRRAGTVAGSFLALAATSFLSLPSPLHLSLAFTTFSTDLYPLAAPVVGGDKQACGDEGLLWWVPPAAGAKGASAASTSSQRVCSGLGDDDATYEPFTSSALAAGAPTAFALPAHPRPPFANAELRILNDLLRASTSAMVDLTVVAAPLPAAPRLRASVDGITPGSKYPLPLGLAAVSKWCEDNAFSADAQNEDAQTAEIRALFQEYCGPLGDGAAAGASSRRARLPRGLTSATVRVDVLNMTRHVNHHYQSDLDGHTRKYTLHVAFNATATAVGGWRSWAAGGLDLASLSAPDMYSSLLAPGNHPNGGLSTIVVVDPDATDADDDDPEAVAFVALSDGALVAPSYDDEAGELVLSGIDRFDSVMLTGVVSAGSDPSVYTAFALPESAPKLVATRGGGRRPGLALARSLEAPTSSKGGSGDESSGKGKGKGRRHGRRRKGGAGGAAPEPEDKAAAVAALLASVRRAPAARLALPAGSTPSDPSPLSLAVPGYGVTSIILTRDMDNAVIPYDTVYGITLISGLRLGLLGPHRVRAYHQFVALPLYQDMAPWNIVFQGPRLDYIDFDTRDHTYDAVVPRAYEVMEVLFNYKRTVEDFKRCGGKASNPYNFPFVSECVGGPASAAAGPCKDSAFPVPCGDGSCRSDYVSCLRVTSELERGKDARTALRWAVQHYARAGGAEEQEGGGAAPLLPALRGAAALKDDEGVLDIPGASSSKQGLGRDGKGRPRAAKPEEEGGAAEAPRKAAGGKGRRHGRKATQ